MITIKSITDVVSISETGILLSGDIDISFQECAGNFHEEYKNSSINCIGERNISLNPPYFEFYTSSNHIRLIFDYKGIFSESKNRKSFHAMQKYISVYGYTTYDLS
ncbi:MAG: hypothetical protein NC205_05555 [Prevotella sp.]|nr:hypothetical protein [Alistipes senegalensis]MCM1358041.1 hypothetical protein [Prevotella sp.]MCM1473360.1 hypothetical protein [Muribaculaceae bacterium]